MSSRRRIRKKSTRIETPDVSTAPAQGMFQSRPFIVQTQTADKSQQQPDLKTALMRARRYGHNLSRMQPAGLEAPTAVQPKLGMRQSEESYRAKAPQMLQAKLSVGAPGDMYEQEADAVAAQVVDRINGSGDRLPAQQPAQEPAQSQPIQQRKKNKSSQPLSLNIQPLVQRESAGSVQDAKPYLERSIEQKRGGGQPLSANIRQPMERSFGADFSGVKVHTDAQSDQLNRSIQAKAFTTDQDIFFQQGAYNPGNQQGQELIAHELTHVVQQNRSAVQRRVSGQLALEPKSSLESVRAHSVQLKVIQCAPKQPEHKSLEEEITNLEGRSLEGFNAAKLLCNNPDAPGSLIRQLKSLFRYSSGNLSEVMSKFAESELGGLLITKGTLQEALNAYGEELNSEEAQEGFNNLREQEKDDRGAMSTLVRMGDRRKEALEKRAQNKRQEQEANELIDKDVQFLLDKGFHKRPDIQSMIAAPNEPGIRGELAEELAKAKAEKRLADQPNTKVTGNIECLRLEEKTASSIPEWLNIEAREQQYQDYKEMKTKDEKKAINLFNRTGGFRQAEGKLWKSQTELDLVVLDTAGKGKPKIIELQQVKSGSSDTHTNAEKQNKTSLEVLRKVAAKDPEYALYERIGKNVLGKNLTEEYDLSNLDNIKTSTLGPKGKTGFTEQFDESFEVLTGIARKLIEMFGEKGKESKKGNT